MLLDLVEMRTITQVMLSSAEIGIREAFRRLLKLASFPPLACLATRTEEQKRGFAFV